MMDKKHKIDYFSENLAVPEIHVDSDDEQDDSAADENDSGGEMIFDNLAIPEIKIRRKKTDKQ